MLLLDLVVTSDRVAATASRSAKIANLAELVCRLDQDEVHAAVSFLSGEPRQGRVGVGWVTMAGLAGVPAADEPMLTVASLDRLVDEIRACTGPGSQDARRDLLANFLGRATAPEQDFVRRLFTGELRQGALEGVMADAVAKAAGIPAPVVRRAAMLAGDLGEVAELALGQGEEAVRAVGFRIFTPVQPMLASTAASVEEALSEIGHASVEWKLDGIRIQAHRRGDDVRLYTRNLNDITGRLPEVVETVRGLDVAEAVFDGEAIAFGDGERPRAFQEIMSAVGRESGAASGVSLFLFDILHVDGDSLIDDPLSVRLSRLDDVAGHLRLPSVMTQDAAEGGRVLDEALAAGHEGVVVKAVDSTYSAGRRGKAWRKVKPVRTLDLVVLGAEWGHGRRHGWLSNLHLGARGPDGGFVMVGKTFKGLTDELLEWQTKAFLERETHRDGITVFVRPDLVVEIALDGVQTSTRYPGGVALRFARVKGYRPDKSPTDADTIDAVRRMLP